MISLIERMLGQVVWRNGNFPRGIAVDEFLRRLSRIVRRVEADIHEERRILLRLLAQMFDGALGPDLRRVLNPILCGILPLPGV